MERWKTGISFQFQTTTTTTSTATATTTANAVGGSSKIDGEMTIKIADSLTRKRRVVREVDGDDYDRHSIEREDGELSSNDDEDDAVPIECVAKQSICLPIAVTAFGTDVDDRQFEGEKKTR